MEVVRRSAMKTYTILGNKHQVTDWVEQPIKMFLIKVEEFFFLHDLCITLHTSVHNASNCYVYSIFILEKLNSNFTARRLVWIFNITVTTRAHQPPEKPQRRICYRAPILRTPSLTVRCSPHRRHIKPTLAVSLISRQPPKARTRDWLVTTQTRHPAPDSGVLIYRTSLQVSASPCRVISRSFTQRHLTHSEEDTR